MDEIHAAIEAAIALAAAYPTVVEKLNDAKTMLDAAVEREAAQAQQGA